MKGLLSIAFLALLISFSSCRNSERDRDVSTESAEGLWIAANHFNNILREVHRVAAVDSVLNGIPVADALTPQSCIDSITRVPDMGPFPIDMTIFYSEEKSCTTDRERSGNIIASFDGIYGNMGTKINVTTLDYEVDGYSVSAEISMEVVYTAIDTLTFDVHITNGTITNTNKVGNNISIQSAHIKFSHFRGRKTVTTTDDDFVITGTGEGIAENGVIYTYNIGNEIVFDASCNYETFGSFILNAPDTQERIMDVGEGGGCDSKMLVTILPANGSHLVEIP
jgi:hypothetical protein